MAVPPRYNTIKEYFEEVLEFLGGYRWVYGFPNTHILVNRVFERFPDEWLPCLEKLSNEEINGVALGEVPADAPDSLRDYFKKMNELKFVIEKKTFRDDFKFPNNSGLSRKKEHEILTLAPLIHETFEESECDLIVDVGTGLGYLPRLLHDKYKYRTLAIEGSPEKFKLAKMSQSKHPESDNSITYFHHFVTDESSKQIQEAMNGMSVNRACITGLHACADLSVTVLELFAKLDTVKSLVIMPCCYHRLKRKGNGFENFPVSEMLSDLAEKSGAKDFLNVPFLRLACQGIEFNKMTPTQREEHANCCLFRAILQEVVEAENYQVRRLKRKSGKLRASSGLEPFEAYLTNLTRTHALVGAEISDDEFLRKMREKWTQHKGNAHLIEALTAFQAAMQDICENVVLLDRVMLLKEKGVECFVVKVTDQGISPRCHAVVAVKP